MANRFPKLFPRLVPVPDSVLNKERNGNGHHVMALNQKSALSDLPRGVYGQSYEFFSPDGGRTIIDLSQYHTSLALVAYWYVATRWRAQKIAEAPLMVAEEDQDDGTEEWLADHDLAGVLESPSPDYDMGELLERTSRYLDDGAEAIWLIDQDRAGRPARITPFKRGEFTVLRTKDRLFGQFRVRLANGEETFDAEEVCYFRDSFEGWGNDGRSRLDVAMSWLRLGERARQVVRDLLDNSVWPSGVIIPDKDWNPDEDTYNQYKQDLTEYAKDKGRPFVALGGGQFIQLAARIRDLIPEELLNRVESVVSAISGVPAIVLQFQVGMENSPWSQMEQARRMAYDDTIQPSWRKIERVLTRQLLRVHDEDVTHFIRFDRSSIPALQENKQEAATIAALLSRMASLNERRVMVGLEPSPDPKADEIPELTTPLLPPGFGGPPAADEEDDTDEEDEAADEEKKKAKERKARRKKMEHKMRIASLVRDMAQGAVPTWKATALRLLRQDMEEIASIVDAYLVGPEKMSGKSIQFKDRAKQRVMTAVVGYLKNSSEKAWGKASTPLLVQAAERSTAVIAVDLGVSYNVLHPTIVRFAQAETAWLVTNVSNTTKEHIAGIISAGIEEGRTTGEIKKLIEESTAFNAERAQLVARTETTRAYNGGPQKALTEYGRSTGRVFTKTWSGSLDDRERDEHLAMEGETVGIEEPFSNGLQYPAEPNCRCAVLHNEVEA